MKADFYVSRYGQAFVLDLVRIGCLSLILIIERLVARKIATKFSLQKQLLHSARSVAHFFCQERQNIDSYRDFQPKSPIFKRP